jgi:hypothetical protein
MILYAKCLTNGFDMQIKTELNLIEDGEYLLTVKSYECGIRFVSIYYKKELKILSEIELIQLTNRRNYEEAINVLNNMNVKFKEVKIG